MNNTRCSCFTALDIGAHSIYIIINNMRMYYWQRVNKSTRHEMNQINVTSDTEKL